MRNKEDKNEDSISNELEAWKSKKMDRRKALGTTAKLGIGAAAVIIVGGGVAAWYASQPPPTPTTITVERTVASTTTIPTTQVVTSTVEKPVEKTVVTTVSGTPTTIVQTVTPTPKKLTVWWCTQYLASEKLAMVEAVRAFEKQTGNEVDITFLSPSALQEKVGTAVEAKKFPDLVFTYWKYIPVGYAYSGLLTDLTGLFNEIKSDFLPHVEEASTQYNKVENKSSIYAINVANTLNMVHFWKDLYGADSAPSTWEEFWASVKKAHYDICKPKDLYGFGLTMADVETDGTGQFSQTMVSFGFDPYPEGLQGRVAIDTPANRKALLGAVEFAVNLYKEGVFPPGVIAWKSADNNNAFHTRLVAGTSNGSLSIPAYQFENNKDNYYNKTFSMLWPVGPYGDDRLIRDDYYVFIFKDAPNSDLAEKFLKFLLTPENYGPYVKGYLGRITPVLKSSLELDKDFWFNPKDPHTPLQVNGTLQRKTVPHMYYHPAWQKIYVENVLPRAWVRVIKEGMTPEQATDEMIKEINKAFEEYK